jgi:arsenic resistance protein ArsH
MANGDLNNTAAERARRELEVDPAYRRQSFAISQSQDDPEVRRKYRPFLLDEHSPEDGRESDLKRWTG